MANRSWANTGKIWAPHVFPVIVDCNVAIGATGAVGTTNGPGVSAVTRLAAGVYKVKFQDNYNRIFGMQAIFNSPLTGSAVAVTAIAPGSVYVITSLGTTTTAQWVTAGVPAGITPAVGVSFLAAATSTGTGAGKLVGISGVDAVELIGDSNTQFGPIGSANQGGYVVFQCLSSTSSSVTTAIPTDPANGSVMFLSFYLSNSSVVVQGE